MSDSTISLSGKAGESWVRVFGGHKAGKRNMLTPFTHARDSETVDVVSFGGKVVETTTVGSLRARGVL